MVPQCCPQWCSLFPSYPQICPSIYSLAAITIPHAPLQRYSWLQYLRYSCMLYRREWSTIPIGIEAVLLSIYNLEVLRRDGNELKWNPPSSDLVSVHRNTLNAQPKEKARRNTISTIADRRNTATSSPPSLTEKALKELGRSALPPQVFGSIGQAVVMVLGMGDWIACAGEARSERKGARDSCGTAEILCFHVLLSFRFYRLHVCY